MAEFQVDVVHGGTLNLSDGSRLTYNEATVLQQTAQGILYGAPTSDTQYAVFIPHRLDDSLTEAWFQQTLTLTQTSQDNGQATLLPRIALARHTLFGSLVIVILAPVQTVPQAIQAHLKQGQMVKAERLVLSTVIPFVTLLDTLSQTGYTALNTLISDFVLLTDRDGNSQPTLLYWGQYQIASQVAPIHGVLHVGSLLIEQMLGTPPRLPLSPFDDTTWQARQTAYLPEGVVSVGLRYLLSALFHAPLEKRFTYDGQPSLLPLREALREWYRLFHQLGSVVDSQNTDVLANFSASLPLPYQFASDSPIANAIWHDLWWRIHLGDTLPHNKRSLQQTLRIEALFEAKNLNNIGRDFLDTLRSILPNNDLSSVKDYVNATRESVGLWAQGQDITQWTLWQHLGRWQLLLDLNAEREIISQVGLLLHKHPSEDTRQILDSVEQALMNVHAHDILFEVRLRQSACIHRQNSDWKTRLNRYHQDAQVQPTPEYLQLSAPARDDFSLRPFTLIGQIVGEYSETLNQLVEAIEVGNLPLALAILEFAQVLPITTAEHDAVETELNTYRDVIALMKNASADNNAQHYFNRASQMLSHEAVSRNPRLRETLERKILDISHEALANIQTANDLKTWDAVRQAQPCYRLLTERNSRHLIEQLRAAYHDTPRSVGMSATMNTYERLFSTYQTLFMASKQYPLWQMLQTERPYAEQQTEAKTILQTLNQALELGISMDEVIASDVSTRQQWQQMIQDAMQTLQRVETVTGEVEQLRQYVQSDGGLAGQIQALVSNLENLQTQIDGTGDDTPSVMGQLRQLRGQLTDIEKSYQAQIQQNRRELGSIQDEVHQQLEAHDILIQRHSQQIGSTGNLVQDARERLSILEHELIQIQKHEAQMLCTYLDAMPQPTRLERINAVLDAIDGMMYALRRCPVEAYDEGCHATWSAQFRELKNRFETLASSKLGWRDRRNLKNNLRQIRALFSECEAEATAKSEANKLIFSKPIDLRG